MLPGCPPRSVDLIGVIDKVRPVQRLLGFCAGCSFFFCQFTIYVGELQILFGFFLHFFGVLPLCFRLSRLLHHFLTCQV